MSIILRTTLYHYLETDLSSRLFLEHRARGGQGVEQWGEGIETDELIVAVKEIH